MTKSAKEFSDPLYGFITILPNELKIIDSFYFQRLRNIKQLGGAYLVFPSAHHTRFEHSLGTLFVADNIYEKIANKLIKNKDEYEYYKSIIRISALIHDIGHPPFSHTAEVLLPGKNDHEYYTQKIVKNTPLKDIIKHEFKLTEDDIEKILRIAVGKPKDSIEKVLTEIITGEFGADRIDYLRRDALFCGVSYGLFDYQRLLNTLDLSDEGTLCIDKSGLRAIENFIIGRYFMYLQVYFHKVVRIMNIHIADLMRDIFNSIDISDLDNYLKLNDTYIISIMFTDERYKHHAQKILERKHFREIFQTKDKDKFIKAKEILLDNFTGDLIRFDEVHKTPYEGQIYIKNGKKVVSANEVSEIIPNLKPIEYYRIYVSDTIKEEACSLLNRLP